MRLFCLMIMVWGFGCPGFGQSPDSLAPEPKGLGFWELAEVAKLTREATLLTDAYRLDEATQKLDSARAKLAKARQDDLLVRSYRQTLLRTQGKLYFSRGRYGPARETYQKYLAGLPEPNRLSYIANAVAQMELALCYNAEGEYGRAVQLGEQVMSGLFKWTSEDDQQLVGFYNQLGNFYMDLGGSDKAMAEYRHAFRISRMQSSAKNYGLTSCLNNLSNGFLAQSRFDSSLFYAQWSLREHLKLYGESDLNTSNAYDNLATHYKITGKFDSAEYYARKVIETRIRPLGEQHPAVARACNNLASVFLAEGNFLSGINYLQKAIAISEGILGKSHPEIAQYYDNLGMAYNGYGDLAKAQAYFDQALRIKLETVGMKHPVTALTYNNLAQVYLTAQDFDKAVDCYEHALRIFQKDSVQNNTSAATVYSNISLCYLQKQQFGKAVEQCRKAYAIQEAVFGQEEPAIAFTCSNLGYALYKNGQKTEGLDLLQRACRIQRKLPPHHPDRLHSLFAMADILRQEDRPEEADALYQEALTVLDYGEGDSLKSADKLPLYIQLLSEQAALQSGRYAREGKADFLYRSRLTYRQALKALNSLSQRLSLGSKSGLAGQAAGICGRLIGIDHTLTGITGSRTYEEEAFELAERSKAFLLYEAMQEARARHIAGIPDSLLELEYRLRTEIAALDKFKWENAEKDIQDEADRRLFDLTRRFLALRDLFADKYPKYYATRYDLPTMPVAEIQKSLLRPGQTLLEYSVGDSSIFLFLVQPDHFEVHKIAREFSLEDWVRDMTRDGIYGFYTLPEHLQTDEAGRASFEKYTRAAQLLFDTLLGPVRQKLTRELLIIPDGPLGYVPFEALLDSIPGRTGNFSKYPFLIKKHAVSYCYSATLLREMRDKKHLKPPTGQLIALAPFALEDGRPLVDRPENKLPAPALVLRDSLHALKASGEELAAIAGIRPGSKALYGRAASLDTFLMLASQYRIVHLSTHGQADDRNGDYAYLAFTDSRLPGVFDKLYARDLYNMELNADLVVLSACETGIGKLQRGEGIVSLARAFAYAGAKSLVTTLWKVDDSTTKDLLQTFYRHLAAGLTKDEALYRAKRDFLETHTGNGGETLHPFFWAGFIAIGDMRALD